MNSVNFSRTARRDWATFALLAALVFAFSSIAISQVCLGLSLLLFFTLRERPQWPAGMSLATAFLSLTLLSALVSDEPRTALPQIRKLFLWALLPLGATLLTTAWSRAALVWGSLCAAAFSGLWSFFEFYSKWQAAQAAHQDFYLAYVAARTTGFMSHWMTFGAHMMIAFALAGAVLLFSKQRSRRDQILLGLLLAVFSLAMLLGWTRSIWLGAFCSAVLLLGFWRPWSLAALPVLVVVTYFVSPAPIRSRIDSVVQPHGEVDSNLHRVITREVGFRMIAAHPLLGIGPDGPAKHFREYLPPERLAKPLPDGFYGHLHNVYLQYAAERGLPALFCLIGFVSLNVRQWLRRPGVMQFYALAAVAGLASSGLFEHNLGDSEVLTLFLALFGIASAKPRGSDGE
jgi:putative inorganic carbon (hco3(-)) transporter